MYPQFNNISLLIKSGSGDRKSGINKWIRNVGEGEKGWICFPCFF